MNSSQRIAVERYAKAYDKISQTGEQARARAAQLTGAVQALAAAQAFMASPKVSASAKKELVSSALQDYPAAAELIAVLLDARRYGLLEAIAARTAELADVRLGIRKAAVFSAKPLTSRQQAEAEQTLSARYGGKVEAVFKTEPSLLGGLKIICDGELIDGSLQGKLIRLEQEISR